MDWLSEHPDGGQILLSCGALCAAAIFIWIQRRRLAIAIPCALIFLIFAAAAIPGFIPARTIAHRNTCINNLKQIQNAKEGWARENHKLPTDMPTEEELYTNGFIHHKLICPSGGKYTIGPVNKNPTCSLTNKRHILE
jgi:hypothetical protein